MNCVEAGEALPLHVAGQLGDDAAFREHLAGCDGCARRAELHGRVWELAGLAALEPLPGGAVRALRAEIARLRPRGRGLAFRAAAVAASALLAWLALTFPPAPPPPMLCAPDDAPSAYVEPAFGDLTVREGPAGPLSLRAHRVTVAIDDWVARTEVEEIFFNDSDRRLEGTFQFPLPADASLSRFAMEVNGTLVEGELVERVRAREVYEGIVCRMQDPALLEWMPGNIFKARIFPIEPRSEKRIVLAYTQAPRTWNGALRYVYPLVSEKTRACPPEELSVRADLRFSREIRKVECPAHRVDVARADARSARVELQVRHARPAADFQLRVELDVDEIEVASHRPPGEDGFLGIAIAPRGAAEGGPAGDHVFVIDRSARMGEKDLEVARRVVDRMLDRLGPEDRAAIVAHHVEVEATALGGATPERRRAWRDLLWGLRGEGASDVVAALQKAAAVAPAGSTIVYVGKGVPTWGEEDLSKAAVGGRALRAVLVGSGANEEGLGRIAGDGVRSIVPGGDVEAQIVAVARTVGSRAVRDLRVEFEGGDVRDPAPSHLPAVYPGERVHVFARYRTPGRAAVVVKGTGFERRVEVDLAAGPTARGALARLWAQRALAERVDECRKRGEPREPVEQIVAMSRQYQVMTPYTSFLVLESEEAYKQYQIDRAKRREEEARKEGGQKERMAGANENPVRLAIHRTLDRVKVDRSFENAKLDDILAHLRDLSGLNIVVDAASASAVDPNESLTLKTKGAPLKDALGQLLAREGLEYVVTEENVVLITPRGGKRSSPRIGPGFSSRESARPDADALALSLRERLDRVEEERARDDYKRVIDPPVGAMRGVAQRMEHMKPDRDNLRPYLEAQADVLAFPDMETWKELISKRKPKGIAELEEDTKAEDKEILEKLRSIRITIDMQNAPLTAIVDYIREISGLNMHITGVENADSEMMTFKGADLLMDGALRALLGPRRLAYIVRDGVVLITSADRLAKQVTLELYDVQDLTYGMKDFPGVDLSLAGDAPRSALRFLERTGSAEVDVDSDLLSIQRKLDLMRIDLAFRKATFDDVLSYLQDFSGLRFQVDEEAKARVGSNRVDLVGKDLRLKDALERLLEPFGLKCDVTPDRGMFVTPAVRTGEDLAALIRRRTGADEWDEAKGTSIQFQNGLLIVRARPELQRQVRRFLGTLRGEVPGEEDRMGEMRRKMGR
jgi:Ca-activated chloride channel family protein